MIYRQSAKIFRVSLDGFGKKVFTRFTMKLNHLLTPLVSDMRAILAHHNADLAAMDHGKTGLKAMYALLDVVSKNRAYNDEHPGFTSGTWKRVLPFDGREYCFYYADGANDTHVATLLKAAKAALLSNR